MQQADTTFTAALQKAMEHMSRGDGEKVVSSCKKLLKKYPENFDVLHLMGVGFRLQGRFDRSLTYYQKALDNSPSGSATLFCNLAFAYLESPGESVFKADEYAGMAREQAPDLQEVYEVSADVSLRTGDPLQAEIFLKRSLMINPDNPNLWLKLARVYRVSGMLDQAMESVERALLGNQSSPEILVELGDIRERRGETDLAIEAYQSAIDYGHQHPEEVDRKVLAMLSTHGRKDLLLSRAQQILSENPDYVPAHLQLLRAGSYPGGTRKGVEFFSRNGKLRNEMIEFAIADGFEKEQNYRDSFYYYLRANKLKQEQGPTYNIQRTERQYERIREFFLRFSGYLVSSTEQDKYPTPVFILGMPRSGTSLTEQLLGSHSQIHPAGELQFLLSMCKFGMNEFRGTRKQQEPDYWIWVRDTYLQCLSRICEGKQFVIDKMPHNYELAGFIRNLFPNAVIVHSHRDPISNCLSIFKANFSGYHPYAQDLKTLGQYYFCYQQLMEFWKAQPGIDILESRYEDLVFDARTQLEFILGRCGLEWEDEISNFHQADRIVRTASNDQVRQPIYQTSIKSWKKYEAHLAPLFDTLLANGVISQADLE